ncbi:hypothetical protein FN846DRAFT_437347 [Sphaerosporella brunnea]|uniref:Uncharacterized protein n=1 Tax=Sphaerosporella brunnea TaxID=1250544 RepID=A0A5J5EFP8_9PEZI|nr:hypothetical protein FN846DRAFT_436521 [Sphaerosporella brunnea]KAA8894188.1 hypothetical protein FN846DRAFT_437347 [Sphaerosporella brunnea]
MPARGAGGVRTLSRSSQTPRRAPLGNSANIKAEPALLGRPISASHEHIEACKPPAQRPGSISQRRNDVPATCFDAFHWKPWQLKMLYRRSRRSNDCQRSSRLVPDRLTRICHTKRERLRDFRSTAVPGRCKPARMLVYLAKNPCRTGREGVAVAAHAACHYPLITSCAAAILDDMWPIRRAVAEIRIVRHDVNVFGGESYEMHSGVAEATMVCKPR